MSKKILIVDDSALMRRVLCDIINSDDRFEVADFAINGADGFKKIVAKKFDAVVLDVYMPQMTGLQMLEEMQRSNVKANVLMASTTTKEGARETLTALELGAIDFITKPENVADTRNDKFRSRFLDLLWAVANANLAGISFNKVQTSASSPRVFESRFDVNFHNITDKDKYQKKEDVKPSSPVTNLRTHQRAIGKKIVAIASSTGGPTALQHVIPKLPSNLAAPVLLVQHMPKGFTLSLAEHLNDMSPIAVEEADDNTCLENGHVYIAKGGKHLKVVRETTKYHLECTDEPAREGVKPCANYMYESLADSNFDEVVCVVLTGMGADGTEGICNLNKSKKLYIIAQDEQTATIYGMPKAIAQTGLVNEICPLDEIAEMIIKEVGVL